MKRKNYIHILFILTLILNGSCSEKQKSSATTEKNPLEVQDINEWIARQVESKLKINATENYTLSIHKEYLDRDTLIDAVILVNREEYAKKKAAEDGDTSFEELVGYTGPYNYVFTHINGSEKLHQAPPVGSSATHPLTVQFETISNPSQKDFYVEYRVKSSINRNYYTINNGRVVLTFSCPLYDFMDPQNPTVYSIKHIESEVRISKDIALYKGKITNYDPKNISDFMTYYPAEVLPTDDLYVYFIYDKKRMKYVTPMTPEE
jgi:hypothetical protein